MSTISLLMDIHEELLEKLQLAHGQPVLITVSYKNPTTGKTDHWMGQNNDFSYDDIEKTLQHLQKQAELDFKPKLSVVQADMHKQFRARSHKARKRLRS